MTMSIKQLSQLDGCPAHARLNLPLEFPIVLTYSPARCRRPRVKLAVHLTSNMML